MSEYIETPDIISLTINIKPEQVADFAAWQAKFHDEIVGKEGFVSIEFIAPNKLNNTWLVVQRFINAKQCNKWQISITYQELIQELKALASPNSIKELSADEAGIDNGVTQLIIAEVLPDKESEYRKWIAKIHSFEAKFPGFRGASIQSPKESKSKFWITLLQFDTMKNLDNWLNSSTRQELLNESRPLISFMETHRVISPYAGWFASIAKLGALPALWKQTMVILLVLYPIVMLEIRYLNPFLTGLNISLSTFIGNAISVSLISFPAMPIAIYFLAWWLSPTLRNSKLNLIGVGIVIFLYLVEIALFWKFM